MYIYFQSEKFHQASKLSTKLASLASEATGSNFEARCELLAQIVSAWEDDTPIHLVKGWLCIILLYYYHT